MSSARGSRRNNWRLDMAGSTRRNKCVTTAGIPITVVTWQLALPAGALIVAGAASAVASDRRRNVEPIEISPSGPALVA